LPNFRDVQIEILGEKYKYRVDEPEEIINKILNEIKSEVENMATNFGKDKINYILLLLLLNERLNVIKTKDEIKNIVNKFENIIKDSENEEQKETDSFISWE
jgi:cell division protein ZapA (FtsZ GTPase activity inhibitor)